MKHLALATQSWPGPFSGVDLLNCFARPAPSEGVGAMEHVQHSGMRQVSRDAPEAGQVACLTELNGRIYAFAGGEISRIRAADGSTDVFGALPPSSNATIAHNGTNVLLCTGGNLYRIPRNSQAIRQIDLSGILSTVSSVTFQDQRFVLEGIADGSNRRDRVAWSNLLGTQFDGLNVATAEADPDESRRVFSQGSQLWVFGSETTEAWRTTADGFERISGAVLDIGILNERAVDSYRSAVFWIGADHRVYTNNGGFGYDEISTAPVVKAIRDGVDPTLFVYRDADEVFLAVRVGTTPAWLFNLKTQKWNRRNSGNEDAARWLATCGEFARDKQYVGGADGHVYEVDPDRNKDGDLTLRRSITSQPIVNPNGFSVDMLKVYARTGFEGGAEILLERSDDGSTWTPDRSESLGEAGDYRRQIHFGGLGWFEEMAQFRLTVTGDARVDVYGAQIETS